MMSLEVDAWAQSLQVTESKVQGERDSFNVSSVVKSQARSAPSSLGSFSCGVGDEPKPSLLQTQRQ